jgi:hypothetical protein
MFAKSPGGHRQSAGAQPFDEMFVQCLGFGWFSVGERRPVASAQSASTNCETTSTAPPISLTERFIFPHCRQKCAASRFCLPDIRLGFIILSADAKQDAKSRANLSNHIGIDRDSRFSDS